MPLQCCVDIRGGTSGLAETGVMVPMFKEGEVFQLFGDHSSRQ